jgi:hypothetical protein
MTIKGRRAGNKAQTQTQIQNPKKKVNGLAVLIPESSTSL